MRRLTAGLLALRSTGVVALILLLWNPASSRSVGADAAPLVLLDASLSMGAGPRDSGSWTGALDTARALARGGVIWRFGAGVAAFDTAPPTDGVSALAPALRAGAARGGRVVIVTDGEIADRAAIPEDLLRRAQVVALPREPSVSFDAFVAAVDGPRRVAAEDTVRLEIAYGTAGRREAGSGEREATLSANLGSRRISAQRVELPDSGVTTAELSLPASRFPAGWSAVEVRLEGVGDGEPRDDARLHVLEVSPQPTAVVVAAPPDWDTRFLAAALRDVARVPVRVFVEAEPAGERRWRDGATLTPVRTADVARAVAGARLAVLVGDPTRLAGFRTTGAVLAWPSGAGRALEGDWYVEPQAASPLSGALAGVRWDSLPPLTSVIDRPPDSAAVTVLAARLGRRGPPRPLMLVSPDGADRRAAVLTTGLWRWQFRGGASAVAYRTLVAALVDWLLEGRAGRGERDLAVPDPPQAAQGLPIVWRWVANGAPRDLVVRLTRAGGAPRVDTLRFDAAGRAELRLVPGVYQYTLSGALARGLVAVEEYSDEWRPAPAVLASQGGAPPGRLVAVGLRDRWWLFALAIAALAAEWAWRRRMGLP